MTTFAYCSLKYRYTKPIIDQKSSKSFIDIKDLRHPIIERINDTEPFTPNDVSLTSSCDVILVYGLNSAGKSTLLKSIGIAVLLAQIGMFVPATRFYFHPFQTFFTKIFVLDNIYKGQSTFLYELAELKHILNLCNDHSLVLCDELTSGTETYSATGLLASTVLHCLHKQSKVVFTTHLHTLSSIPEITENAQISIQHFSVSVQNENIVYDRKLEPGMGHSLYGIEIAEAIGFPSTFIKTAFDVRNKIAGKSTELVTNRRSRYNKKVIVDSCSKCGSNKNLHTHHIVHQHLSDEHGFIGPYHKNRAFNLKVLCAKCHQEEHLHEINEHFT
jgi:DNA mismatch repair protein MutS